MKKEIRWERINNADGSNSVKILESIKTIVHQKILDIVTTSLIHSILSFLQRTICLPAVSADVVNFVFLCKMLNYIDSYIKKCKIYTSSWEINYFPKNT